MSINPRFENLDDNESVYFLRELSRIKPQTYDILYPELKMLGLLPIDTGAGNGLEYIIYRGYDSVGGAKLIQNFSEDLPRIDVKASETIQKIHSFGASYGYSIQDIRTSAAVGKQLDVKKAQKAKFHCDLALDTLALLARPGVTFDIGGGAPLESGSLTGLIYQSGISIYTVDAESGNYIFSAKTADAILRDLNKLAWYSYNATKGIEQADTILLPNDQFRIISTTYRSAYSDLSLKDAFLAKTPFIKTIEPLPRLAAIDTLPSGTGGTKDIAIAYKKDPQKLTLDLCQPFEQFDPQLRNMEYVVDCHFRTAGVLAYYPKSITIVEGI